MAIDGNDRTSGPETPESPEPLVHEIEEPNLRTVFPREDRDFTPWLSQPENLARLARTLKLEIEFEAAEVDSGNFRADILAKSLTNGSLLVIESQFGRSDHDHFGKAMTYLAVHGAKTVIWLAETFADEHRAALTWLNDNTPEDVGFYAVRPRLMRIAASPPGLRFDIVVAPNTFVKQGRRGNYVAPDARIMRLRTLDERCAKSPRSCKPGTERYTTFQLYSDGMTVADFLAKGGRRSSLLRDIEYGHIKLLPPVPATSSSSRSAPTAHSSL